VEFTRRQQALVVYDALPQSVVIAPGAIRSGKTVAAAQGFVEYIHQRGALPGDNYIIAAQRRNIVTGVMLPNVEAACERIGITYRPYNSVTGRAGVGGSDLVVASGSTTNAEHALQGLTASGAWCDEVTSGITEAFVTTLQQRCSVPDAKLLITTNPGSPNHWLKVNWIDRYRDIDAAVYAPFTLRDVPASAVARGYAERLQATLSGAAYERMVLGKWASPAGACFPDFRPAEVPSYPPVAYALAVDPGTITHCLLVAEYIDWEVGEHARRWWVVDEYRHDARAELGSAGTEDELARRIGEWLGARVPRVAVVDPAARTFKLSVQHVLGIPVAPPLSEAASNVVEGTRTLAILLSRGAFNIAPPAVETIRSLATLQWGADGRPLKGAAAGEADHAVDACRYAAGALIPAREREAML